VSGEPGKPTNVVVPTPVVVVGGGKMGLPLACALAEGGARVTVCDTSSETVAAISEGRASIDEPGVPELVRDLVARRALSATADTAAAVAEAEATVVIVPALLTPDLDVDPGNLVAASRAVARGLRRGALVSYETTMPVGGTRRHLLPVLEASGLRAGKDFDLVFSPERVKSRTVLRLIRKTPKVVGGITPASAERGVAFYGRFLGAPTMNVGTLEAAEMVKLAGMVYRDVNIALANELARYAEAAGVDLPPLLEAINSDGEAALLQPGIGVGGHCTPVYSHFLLRDAERLGVAQGIAERARSTNDGQPAHALGELERAWGSLRGKRAVILGLAFRPGVKEHHASPAFQLRDELEARGARVGLVDPLYSREEIAALGFETEPGPAQVLVLVTAHSELVPLDLAAWKARGVEAVLDGRNVLPAATLREAGILHVGIGRGSERRERKDLPIAKPVLGAAEAEAAATAVRSGWVLQGPQVEAFERELAAFTGAPHAVALSSGTAALHLALRALGVGPGDEVVTVSHSFIATANAIRHCGAEPVFVDVEPRTFNIDPRRVEAALGPRTKAILCVHQIGMPCDLGALLALAQERGVFLVEDAACAVGSEVQLDGKWERIGRPHGDIACFSFHPRKIVTTGDGGAITTARADWAERVRSLRQHGTLDGKTFREVGWNFRMTDIQAAVGRKQLERLPRLVARRRELAAAYARALPGIRGVRPPLEPSWARSNFQSYCVLLPEGASAETVGKRLLADGIATRPGIANAHQSPAYAATHGRLSLPESEDAAARGLILPLTHDMSTSDVERVVRSLERALVAPPVTP
jgi:nucleotide sugar dehydrogenase